MSELVRVCSKGDLPRVGEAKEFNAGSKTLCVANVGGRICALDNECPHQGGPLSEGMIEAGKVVCPWHAWAFDPVTGATAEGDEGVAVYPVSIEQDEVFVSL